MGRDVSVRADRGHPARAAAPSADCGANDPGSAVACDGQGGLCALRRYRRGIGAAMAAGRRLCIRSARGRAWAAGGAARACPPRLPRARQSVPGFAAPLDLTVARRSRATGRTRDFSNDERARIAQPELGFSADRLRIVWNMPRVAELPALHSRPEAPFVVYYHGSIAPDLLPLTVVEAVLRLQGRACLRIVGYEAPGAASYVQRLLALGGGGNSPGIVDYAGQVRRADLLATAAHAHVGLALIPCNNSNLNLSQLTGASNKPFDYMAAGLALLVSDRPDWRDMFAAPGYARSCEPGPMILDRGSFGLVS